VACTIYSVNPDDDLALGGVIHFDSLSLMKAGSAFSAWQMQWFGTTSGPNVSATGDYDVDHFSNWSEFVAGTDPTLISSYLAMDATRASAGSQSVILRWGSVEGRYYQISGRTNLMSGAFSIVGANNIPATPPMNTYTAAPPVGVECQYYRVEVNTIPFE